MMPEITEKGAELSVNREYRYVLWRAWEDGWRKNAMLFIGLNPSTADENEDDPTIRRCIDFANRSGHTGMVMANLFSYRATDPADLKRALRPLGANEDDSLLEAAALAKTIVCAWGAHGKYRDRDIEVMRLLMQHGHQLYCFGKTKNGCPKHPLYLPKTSKLEPIHDL